MYERIVFIVATDLHRGLRLRFDALLWPPGRQICSYVLLSPFVSTRLSMNLWVVIMSGLRWVMDDQRCYGKDGRDAAQKMSQTKNRSLQLVMAEGARLALCLSIVVCCACLFPLLTGLKCCLQDLYVSKVRTSPPPPLDISSLHILEGASSHCGSN